LALHLGALYQIVTARRDEAELAAIGSGLPAAGDNDERRTRARFRWRARLARLFGGIGMNGDIHGQLHRG